MNSYDLSRRFFDWSFENPEKIRPTHVAMYFFIIEHCNRLGWKEKFGLPTTMVKEAIGIKNFRTYTNTLNDLVDWGFIFMIEKSKNQYSSNIIAIVKNAKAPTKALDKALQKHSQKQRKSIDSINKQGTNNLETIETIYSLYPSKCLVKGSSTGKTAKNKEKIANLLKTHSPEYVQKAINDYVANCTRDKVWMKNFGTFLNNLPEPETKEDKPKIYSWRLLSGLSPNYLESGTKEVYEREKRMYGENIILVENGN